MKSITPFLMFEGQAEAAMDFYVSVIPKTKIVAMSKYGLDGAGTEGEIQQAVLSIDGIEYTIIDSPVKHDFTFTPAFSLYLQCDSLLEITLLFKSLSENGSVHMPLDNYGFSEKYAWVSDRFGISWQLNL